MSSSKVINFLGEHETIAIALLEIVFEIIENNYCNFNPLLHLCMSESANDLSRSLSLQI